MICCFSVAGVPVPQGSMRGFVVKGRAILTSDNAKLKPWRQCVELRAREACTAPPSDVPMRVVLEFVMPRPASVKRTKRPLPTTKPDVDKLVRAVLDACTGVVWFDDSQVTTVHASKRYDDVITPGVLVEVSEDAA